jgi:hypothetical protein
MPALGLLLFIVLWFGPSFYWGFIGGGLLVPLLLAAAMAVIGVKLAGWRAPGKGAVASALIATCFSAAVNVPVYFTGRWLG